MFLFIAILFGLCLHKPYIFLFKCNFDSLERQFGTYCFYVDLESSSKIKLICVPTHYYWSIPFSAVKSLFFYYHLRLLFQTIVLSTNSPMLSLQLIVLSYNSVWSCQNWKIHSQTGIVFCKQSFWVPTTQCYLQHWIFHPMFLFIAILFGLCLHKPYFFPFQVQFW